MAADDDLVSWSTRCRVWSSHPLLLSGHDQAAAVVPVDQDHIKIHRLVPQPHSSCCSQLRESVSVRVFCRHQFVRHVLFAAHCLAAAGGLPAYTALILISLVGNRQKLAERASGNVNKRRGRKKNVKAVERARARYRASRWIGKRVSTLID